MKAILMLEDGTIFEGNSIGIKGEVIGKIVFNTGMTGYQEVLTDPSYYGQIVTMTYPLIGNYGINEYDMESSKPQVKGFIVKESCDYPNNWRCKETLNQYLKRNNVIGIEGIDTRALTKILRNKGTMNGIISTNKDFRDRLDDIKKYSITNAVMSVTCKNKSNYEGNGYNIALIDLGVKNNIIRSLVSRGCNVTVFPANTSYKEIVEFNPDGIMYTNGPGDPKECVEIINNIKELIKINIPIFGICLGHQLIALSHNFDTEKLKYGHRGCNHPVKDLNKDITYITSQNHGYAVIPSSVDTNIAEISHININDNTVEGIRYKNKPIFTVQFHPEACPGPKDSSYLFDEFINNIANSKEGK
jgi:carbamoyl-phosphate synthase small subunit